MTLVDWPAIASALDRQARTLGRAQLAAVRSDRAALASAFRGTADLQDELVECLTEAL